MGGKSSKNKRKLHRAATSHGDGHHPVFSVFVTTWNMGDAKPDSKPFDDWFLQDGNTPTDIIAVGVQEGSYESQKKNGKKVTCDKHWHAKIEKYLNNETGASYKMVAREVMLTMSIVVFVRDTSNLKLSAVRTSQEATGIGHVVGNKGGVMVSFQLNDTSFCFISSHLAAHQGKIAERNRDYKEIITGLDSGDKLFDATNLSHYVFWMGDLNYRIDEDRDETLGLIGRGDLDALLEKDQLMKERKEGRVFCGFDEAAKINFAPTYKFDPGTINYAEEKARVPSWCDRILVKTLAGCDYVCQDYDSAPSVRTSDHIPVYGFFEVTGMLNPKNAQGKTSSYNVLFRNVQGHDLIVMDVKSSDPYFHIVGASLDGKFKTKHVNSTLTPAWKDKNIPTVTTVKAPVEYIEDCPVLLSMMDYDALSQDDKMGQGSISLKGAFNKWIEFTCDLFHRGYPAGYVTGAVCFHDSKENAPEMPSPAFGKKAAGEGKKNDGYGGYGNKGKSARNGNNKNNRNNNNNNRGRNNGKYDPYDDYDDYYGYGDDYSRENKDIRGGGKFKNNDLGDLTDDPYGSESDYKGKYNRNNNGNNRGSSSRGGRNNNNSRSNSNRNSNNNRNNNNNRRGNQGNRNSRGGGYANNRGGNNNNRGGRGGGKAKEPSYDDDYYY